MKFYFINNLCKKKYTRKKRNIKKKPDNHIDFFCLYENCFFFVRIFLRNRENEKLFHHQSASKTSLKRKKFCIFFLFHRSPLFYSSPTLEIAPNIHSYENENFIQEKQEEEENFMENCISAFFVYPS